VDGLDHLKKDPEVSQTQPAVQGNTGGRPEQQQHAQKEHEGREDKEQTQGPRRAKIR
jgi:hypothetical protein